MKKSILTVLCVGMLLGAGSILHAQTIQVSGAISSDLLKMQWTPNGITATFKDTWTGDLAGHGHTHIFSSGPLNEQNGEIHDIISTLWLVTPQGNLIFDGVGNTTGPFLHLVATIRQGTGLYNGAHGQLVSDGMIGPDGVESTYSGSITLNQ
jgi:hypothetical protein